MEQHYYAQRLNTLRVDSVDVQKSSQQLIFMVFVLNLIQTNNNSLTFWVVTELLQGGFLSSSLPILYCTMEILDECQEVESEESNDVESLFANKPTVLYRVIPGLRHKQSLALWCAKTALIPINTLSRGKC